MKNLLSFVGLMAAGLVLFLMTPQQAGAVPSFSRAATASPSFLTAASSAGLSFASLQDFESDGGVGSSVHIPIGDSDGADDDSICSVTGPIQICSSGGGFCTTVQKSCSSRNPGETCSAVFSGSCSAAVNRSCSSYGSGHCSVISGAGGKCTTGSGGGRCSVRVAGDTATCSVINDDGTVTGGSDCSGE